MNFREEFILQLNDMIQDIHNSLSGGREKLILTYEPHTPVEELENSLKEADLRMKSRRQLFADLTGTTSVLW